MAHTFDFLHLERALLQAERADQTSPRLEKFESLLLEAKTQESKLGNCVRYLEHTSQQEELQMFYVGGFLRDLWLAREDTRDIDIMFNVLTKNRFERALKDKIVRRNRFGGLKLDIEGMLVDAWPVEETYSFAQREILPAAVSVFPSTTFFTVESIVLEVYAPDERRWGWENGFFAACENKELEVQNYQNPFPHLQLVRAHTLHEKLTWSIGQKLAHFIKAHLPKYTAEELAHTYHEHYGIKIKPAALYTSLENMR